MALDSTIITKGYGTSGFIVSKGYRTSLPVLTATVITKGYGASAFIVTKGYRSGVASLIYATVSTACGITWSVDVLTGNLTDDAAETPFLLNGYPVPQSVQVATKTLVANGKLYYKIKNSNYYIGMN